MEFDERQLRAFLAIADTGSLGRAAAVVNLTQPSLSRLILAMEQRLGHRLFERRSKGMALTPAGDVLLPHARLLVFEMRAARDELDALSGLRRGVVRIGAVAAAMRTLVAEALGRLLAAHPALTAETIDGVDGELRDALLERRIDLAVTAAPIDHPEAECLGACAYSGQFGVFGAATNPLPDRPGLEALAEQVWTMPAEGAAPRLQFEAVFRAHGLPSPTVAAVTASVETMIALSAAGPMLCWLPLPLAAAHVASGSLRRFVVPEMEPVRRLLLYKRRAGLLPDAARQFLRHFPLAP